MVWENKDYRSDKHAVERYMLAESSDSEHVLYSIEQIKDLFKFAESGVYPLLPAAERDEEAIKLAVEQTTFCRVERVVFVSFSDPYPKPDWMCDEYYNGAFQESLKQNHLKNLGNDPFQQGLENNISISLKEAVTTKLERLMRDKLHTALKGSRHGTHCMANFYSSIWDNLYHELKKSLWSSLSGYPKSNLWNNLKSLMDVYFGFAMAGDRASTDMMLPIIREVQKSMPPFGFKHNERKTLLVPAK
jgi:hypothetical protein